MPLLTTGAAASTAWLAARGLRTKPQHWYVELVLTAALPETRFELTIYPEEWGFVVRSEAKLSTIRITDIPFVHGRDDFGLLRHVPQLEDIEVLLETVELVLATEFDRKSLAVRSNVAGVGAAVRGWLG